MKRISKVFALILTLAVFFSMAVFTSAEDGNVSYEGQADLFVFLPGSSLSDSTLFPNFENCMPGDKLTQKVIVTNNSKDADYVKIYLRAEAHDEESNPLETGVKETETVASMSDFLAQLHMTVVNDKTGETIFDGSPDKEDGLKENVLLGSYEKGASSTLTVTLEVPITLGNEYADRRGEVDWIFTVEELYAKPHLTIEKTVTNEPKDEKGYAAGETVTYKVTAKNDGNLTLFNVEVKDELTGDTWTIEKLEPEETKEFETSYVVTQKDVDAGSVKNVATATSKTDNPDIPELPEEDIVPGEVVVDTAEPHLTITKKATSTSEDKKGYKEGEKVLYSITATNDGDVTLYNVVVKDDLTGESWTITELKPGESKSFETDYTVTEKDVETGSITNNATATAKTAGADGPAVPDDDIVPGKEIVPTMEDVPDTGDTSNVWLYAGLACAAVLVLVILLILRRKQSKED